MYISIKLRIITIVLVIGILTAECAAVRQNIKQGQEKWKKDSIQTKLSAANQQFELGQYEQAEFVAKELIASNPKLADAYLLLGQVKFVKGEFSAAKDCLHTHIKLKPASDQGAFWLGLTYERLKDNAAAAEWYKKALELLPDNTDYIITFGKLLTSEGKFDEAEKLYQTKIAANPGNIDLKIAAAQMYLAAGQNDRAVKLYEQAHLIAPANTELLEALASCYVVTNNWQKAYDAHKKLYQQCSDSNKKNGYLRIMALCATNSGDYSLAMSYYSQLVARDKTDARLWFLMGQAALGADQTRQALICSKKALSLKPNMPDAYLLSGSANYKSGNYSQAIDDFQKAISNGGDAHFAWLMTARCYERLSDFERARNAYEKASQLSGCSELQKLLVKQQGDN